MSPSSPQAIAALTASAQQRSADARARIDKALRDLRRSGTAININAVARRSGVSRATIYKHHDLRAKIEAHAVTASPPPPATVTENAIMSALRAQLTAKDREIQQLRTELKARDSLITALYGKLDTYITDSAKA